MPDTEELFNGPAELIVPNDEPKFVYPNNTGEMVVEKPAGKWECVKCGNLVGPTWRNGELHTPPDGCESCNAKTEWEHVGPIDDDDIAAAKRITGALWHVPTAIEEVDYQQIWDGVKDYLRAHWDASEDEVYEGLTAYAITTWFRESMDFVPHILLQGKTTGGKTRLLNTIARVSYRGMVTASATPASMFRLVDGYRMTYYVSEYHGLSSGAKQELDNIVRAAQKRGEMVTRAEQGLTGYEPKVYDPFTHVAVASQEQVADDIRNRCIEVRSTPNERDIPATFDEEGGEELRNQLLYARFLLLDSELWENAEAKAYQYCAEHNIDGRTREKLLGILTVAHIWNKVDAIDPFVDVVVQQDKAAAADSEDALFVQALRDLGWKEAKQQPAIGTDVDGWDGVTISYDEIGERIEAMTGEEISPSMIGNIRKRLDLNSETKRNGTIIEDAALKNKLQRHCADLNLDWEPSDVYGEVESLERYDQAQGNCAECGYERQLTHRTPPLVGNRICSNCADDLA